MQAEAGPQAAPNHQFAEFFAVSVADDRQTAYEQIRPSVAHWLGVPYPQPVHKANWNLQSRKLATQGDQLWRS